jgi:hypothetical protein
MTPNPSLHLTVCQRRSFLRAAGKRQVNFYVRSFCGNYIFTIEDDGLSFCPISFFCNCASSIVRWSFLFKEKTVFVSD